MWVCHFAPRKKSPPKKQKVILKFGLTPGDMARAKMWIGAHDALKRKLDSRLILIYPNNFSTTPPPPGLKKCMRVGVPGQFSPALAGGGHSQRLDLFLLVTSE